MWLPEVVLFLLPPAVLVGVVWRRDGAAALWCIAAGYVALAYPALSGAALLAYYLAVYTMASGVVVSMLVQRAVRRPVSKDEAVVACLAFAALADVVLMAVFGAESWAAVMMPNAAVYLAALLAALSTPRVQGPPVAAALQTPSA